MCTQLKARGILQTNCTTNNFSSQWPIFYTQGLTACIVGDSWNTYSNFYLSGTLDTWWNLSGFVTCKWRTCHIAVKSSREPRCLQQLRLELLWHRKVRSLHTCAPFLDQLLPTWKPLSQATSRPVRLWMNPTSVGHFYARKNLSPAWNCLIQGSIWSTFFNIPSRRESGNVAVELLLCVKWHVVSEILVSSHKSAFQRILHFFCSCQFSLNIFWNLCSVTVGWKLA